ncbi:SDR family NAD(P)-dependent oxidoreductase [Agrobacterium leguminum]|uniref:SDR family NAD(P)-dependent oxidoreductase n=1 Tax=Agrobacterium TaxID=357 RepID=UPI0015733B16|nr:MULTISPECIES: SDR family NAD(P)-dependent oxidoreductase [Agrobacterium]MCZ7934851.1 SDR family NAD(P)-dependent oxidoreductase [Agrobacterium leguminum]MCZ7976986.1 SDR family NAD(P)-dependent oxidoreductase [Agrobacterium salinitolerans]NSX94144.1 SDR family oxidoreductase [Agrobacterium tumefaciens]NTA35488.1 SDR family oxidoreductase [Agrobacterium salinitolerans]
MAKLSGRTAFVTGASSGVGLAAARHLVDQGARVAISARRVDILRHIASEAPDSFIVVQTDVADAGSVDNAIDHSWQELGHIDYVIHAAGIVTPAAMADLTPAVWKQHIDINLTGSYNVLRTVAMKMRQRGEGSIVSIASDLSFKGLANYAHYCASKAGLAGLTKALALELAPTVRVNCVCPGPIDTPMMDSELEWFGGSDEVRAVAVAAVPLKRFSSPEEIAEFAVYVAAKMRFATGSMLSIDGGTTAG